MRSRRMLRGDAGGASTGRLLSVRCCGLPLRAGVRDQGDRPLDIRVRGLRRQGQPKLLLATVDIAHLAIDETEILWPAAVGGLLRATHAPYLPQQRHWLGCLTGRRCGALFALRYSGP